MCLPGIIRFRDIRIKVFKSIVRRKFSKKEAGDLGIRCPLFCPIEFGIGAFRCEIEKTIIDGEGSPYGIMDGIKILPDCLVSGVKRNPQGQEIGERKIHTAHYGLVGIIVILGWIGGQ